MELEQRIKSLEYEVKLLKNDTQRILLEIQEQILMHYYPALRQEDTVPTEGVLQTIETLRAKKAAQEAGVKLPPSNSQGEEQS